MCDAQAGVMAGMVATGWFEKNQKNSDNGDLLSDSCHRVRNMAHKFIMQVLFAKTVIGQTWHCQGIRDEMSPMCHSCCAVRHDRLSRSSQHVAVLHVLHT